MKLCLTQRNFSKNEDILREEWRIKQPYLVKNKEISRKNVPKGTLSWVFFYIYTVSSMAKEYISASD